MGWIVLARELREKADHARRLAGGVDNAVTKKTLEEFAREYDEKAAELERQQVPDGQKPASPTDAA
jgi:hypothetical protein